MAIFFFGYRFNFGRILDEVLRISGAKDWRGKSLISLIRMARGCSIVTER